MHDKQIRICLLPALYSFASSFAGKVEDCSAENFEDKYIGENLFGGDCMVSNATSKDDCSSKDDAPVNIISNSSLINIKLKWHGNNEIVEILHI